MNSASHSPVADAVARHWADRLLPAAVQPYARLMRLERPIGWWLLLLPGWWSIALAADAAGTLPDLRALALFLAGAIVMRGAGCTWNDITDRDFDAQVARTRSRPIPSGQVSVRAAKIFLIALLALGFVILIQFDIRTIIIGASSLGLVALYPFMKRVTYWPQFFLGLAFNWSALTGWPAATGGGFGLPALLLYAGGIFWTLAYDTIYAHQDKEDDLLIGVKSTALRLGAATPGWLAGFFAAAFACFTAAAILAGTGAAAYIGLGAAGLLAIMQLRSLDIDDPQRCLALFRANRNLGLAIFAGFTADALIKVLTSA